VVKSFFFNKNFIKLSLKPNIVFYLIKMNSKNSTFADIGLIIKNLHYGLFASHWWHETIDTSSSKKNYIRLD
jgi:hypothetical protein